MNNPYRQMNPRLPKTPFHRIVDAAMTRLSVWILLFACSITALIGLYAGERDGFRKGLEANPKIQQINVPEWICVTVLPCKTEGTP